MNKDKLFSNVLNEHQALVGGVITNYTPKKAKVAASKHLPTPQGWRDFYRQNIWSNRHNRSNLIRAMERFQNAHGFSDDARKMIWYIEQNKLPWREPGDETWHLKNVPDKDKEVYMNLMPDELEDLRRDLDKYKGEESFE